MDVFLKARRDIELEGKDTDKAKNVGFRIYDQGMVTYEQNKLGLSAYYEKRYVLADGIHTRPLGGWSQTIIFLELLPVRPIY